MTLDERSSPMVGTQRPNDLQKAPSFLYQLDCGRVIPYATVYVIRLAQKDVSLGSALLAYATKSS